MFKLVTSDEFDYFMQFIIFLNIIPIILDFATYEGAFDNVEGWIKGLAV